MDVVATIARTSFSLLAVLGLLWLTARWLRRRGGVGAGAAGEFAVLGRASVGPKASVAIVKVGRRALVVGVSDQGVTLLADTEVEAVFPTPDPTSDPTSDAGPAVQATPGAQVDLTGQGPVVPAPSVRTAPSGTTPTGTTPAPTTAVTGSALSPATWTKAVDVLRERTTRR